MFIDSAIIDVSAGSGGNGIVAFRREKFVALGGPAGGSGGVGGNVIVEIDLGLKTLLDFKYQKKYSADNGENGKSKSMNGKNADDLILKVPPGTMIYNNKTGELLYDMYLEDQKETLLKGGRGGRGNVELAQAGRHALEISENGEPGQVLELRMELKLLADVGLVGLPSVGKSSFISVISKSRPKIAEYHFTTLAPNLGVVKATDNKSFVVSDLPGLIEGASLGKGLGIEFLKHIERTKIIAHIIDMGSFEGRNPIDDYEIIKKELQGYKYDLDKKKSIVIANKMDLPEALDNLKIFKEKYPNIKVYEMSTVTKTGVNEAVDAMGDILNNIENFIVYEKPVKRIYKYEKEIDFHIEEKNGAFYVTGPTVTKLISMTNFNTYDNIRRLSNQLKGMGLEDRLREMGAVEGSPVLLEEFEFEFVD